MEKLESELAEKQKVQAKAQAALTNKKDTVKQEQKKLQQLKKQQKSVSINFLEIMNLCVKSRCLSCIQIPGFI